MEQKKTSSEAAALLGLKRTSLMSLLTRHPHLKPAERFNGDYIWSEAEIEAVAKSRRGPGRPAKATETA
jgi:hypothetical protein